MLHTLFASALAVGAVAATASYNSLEESLAARQTVTGKCPTLHVIALGGANSPDPTAIGLLGTLAMNITAQVPGSDFVSVPYNKVQRIIPNSGGKKALMPGAVPAGIMTEEQYISEFVSSCPKSKVALIGYSAGAVIQMSSICDAGTVDKSLAGSTIVAIIDYGDQTRVPGPAYDVGTGGQACVGRNANLRHPATCGAFASVIQSYCDINDPECCGGPNPDEAIHLTYPAKYDLIATKYVVSQYMKLSGGAVGGSSSSSSSMMSSTMTSSSTMMSSMTSSSKTSMTSMTSSMTSSMPKLMSSMTSSEMSSMMSSTPKMSSMMTSMATSSPMNSVVLQSSTVVVAGTGSATNSVTVPSSTLTPFGNGASLVAPSFFLGALAVVFAALY